MKGKWSWLIQIAVLIGSSSFGWAQEAVVPEDLFAIPANRSLSSIPEAIAKTKRSHSDSLSLNYVKVLPGELALLADPELKGVTELSINSPDLQDSDIQQLAPLNLKSLALASKQLSAAALKSVALEKLTELGFAGGRCDDTIVEELKRFQGHTLSLICPGLTDAGLARLDISKLKQLAIQSDLVTDAGLSALKGSSIEQLNLYRMKLTDRAVDHLLLLQRLSRFDARFSGITDAGMATLARARPAMQLILDAKEWTLPPSGAAQQPRDALPSSALPEGELFWTVTYGGGNQGLAGAREYFGPPLFGSLSRNGFDADGLLPLPQGTTDAAVDGDRIIVLARGTVGFLDRRGVALPDQPAGSPLISSATRFALDAKNRQLFVVGDSLLRYDLTNKVWTPLRSARNRFGYSEPVAVCPTDSLLYSYRTDRTGQGRDIVSVLDQSGAEVRSVTIEPGLPQNAGKTAEPRLFCTDQGLLVLVQYAPVATTTWRLFKVDEAHSALVELGYDPKRDPSQGLWPGMKDGPIGIVVPGSDCGQDSAMQPLSYTTPQALLPDKQALHVVAVKGGVCPPDPDHEAKMQATLQELSKGPSAGDAAQKLDALMKSRYSCPVHVRVPKLAGSIVLWLQAETPGGWKLEVDKSTKISKVYVVGPEPAPLTGFSGKVERDPTSATVPIGFDSREGRSVAFEPFIRPVRTKTGLRERAFVSCPYARQVVLPADDKKTDAK